MKAVWAAEEMTPAGERWEGSRIAANAGKRDVAGVAAAVKRGTAGAAVAVKKKGTAGAAVAVKRGTAGAAVGVKTREMAGAAAAVKRRDMTMMGVGVWSGKATLTVPA